jgi:hypothetical protein
MAGRPRGVAADTPRRTSAAKSNSITGYGAVSYYSGLLISGRRIAQRRPQPQQQPAAWPAVDRSKGELRREGHSASDRRFWGSEAPTQTARSDGSSFPSVADVRRQAGRPRAAPPPLMAAAAAASVTGAGETTAAAMSGLPAAPAELIDLAAIGWDEQSMNELVEDKDEGRRRAVERSFHVPCHTGVVTVTAIQV